MTPELYFITSNEGKIAEAQAILGFPISITKLEIDEIQDSDIEQIAYKKVAVAFAHIKKPVIVDDAGLYIEAWNGFPGPFVKYIDKAGTYELLLQMMHSEKNRNATFKAAIGYHDGKTIHTFLGEVKGKIALEKRGENGWGFDPIFIPEGYTQTFSELHGEVKNTLSHRKKALEKLKIHLLQQGR
jgi:XTP/dITP diphosphohydrolase